MCSEYCEKKKKSSSGVLLKSCNSHQIQRQQPTGSLHAINATGPTHCVILSQVLVSAPVSDHRGRRCRWLQPKRLTQHQAKKQRSRITLVPKMSWQPARTRPRPPNATSAGVRYSSPVTLTRLGGRYSLWHWISSTGKVPRLKRHKVSKSISGTAAVMDLGKSWGCYMNKIQQLQHLTVLTLSWTVMK